MENVYVFLDGTECRIDEPSKLSSKYFSHKLKGSGLRYDIGICISTQKLFGWMGHIFCGKWPDISMFKQKMLLYLSINESDIEDKGYRNETCIKISIAS